MRCESILSHLGVIRNTTQKMLHWIPFAKLDPRATVPRLGSKGAAGHDLFPLEEVILPPKATNVSVPTGIAVDISVLSDRMAPLGVYGRVAPRSGLAYRHGVDVLAGVIDRDYRGQIHVIMNNPSDEPVVLSPTQAIAQLIFELHVDSVGWQRASSLGISGRGPGKFGSTDTKV